MFPFINLKMLMKQSSRSMTILLKKGLICYYIFIQKIIYQLKLIKYKS